MEYRENSDGTFRVECPDCGRIYDTKERPTEKGHLYCGPCAYYLRPEKYHEPLVVTQMPSRGTMRQEHEMKIMVVDDEISQLWVDVLRDSGFDVDGFHDPIAAIGAFDPEKYNLLASGFLMPTIKGDELLRRLREKKPELRAIMVSASMDAPLAAQEAGFDAFLSKPATIAEFLKGVRRAMNASTEPKPADTAS